MDSYSLCVELIKKYYQQIYRYCYARLNQHAESAQDCTQDIFMILFEKRDSLNLEENMRGWLYATADRVISNYLRKERKYENRESLDPDMIADYSDLEKMYARENPRLNSLSDEDYSFIKEYYDTEHGDRHALANRFGMTMGAMYSRAQRIRKKMKKK